VEALSRAFGDALPASSANPGWAVAGDFNGDDSVDLAVPARALPDRVATLNGEWRNWILQDPARAPALDIAVRADGPPLAVVHGVGGSGWRNPEARQAYLVKMPSTGRLEVRPRDEARGTRHSALSRRRGEMLYVDAEKRFLVWTGAQYAWHPRHPE